MVSSSGKSASAEWSVCSTHILLQVLSVTHGVHRESFDTYTKKKGSVEITQTRTKNRRFSLPTVDAFWAPADYPVPRSNSSWRRCRFCSCCSFSVKPTISTDFAATRSQRNSFCRVVLQEKIWNLRETGNKGIHSRPCDDDNLNILPFEPEWEDTSRSLPWPENNFLLKWNPTLTIRNVWHWFFQYSTSSSQYLVIFYQYCTKTSNVISCFDITNTFRNINLICIFF